jgi:hypothetical protein
LCRNLAKQDSCKPPSGCTEVKEKKSELELEVTDVRTQSEYLWTPPLKFLQGSFRCKHCKGERKHMVVHYPLSKFVTTTCSDCQKSINVTYENVKLCLILLVCVELNPGPKRKADEIAVIVNKPHKRSKTGHQNISSRTGLSKEARELDGMGPVSKAYIMMLCDPIHAQPLCSGFMTWVKTLLASALIKGTTTTTNDGVVFFVNPDASLSNSTATSGIVANYLTITQFNGSTPGTPTGVPAANKASVLSTINTNRVLASGMELQISHAATAQSGVIGITRFNGLVTNTDLDAYTPSLLQALPQTSIFTTNGGNATINANWLPADATDFEFSNNGIFNNGEGIYNPYVVSLTGFPAGTRVFYEVLTHLEGETGGRIGASVADEKAGPPAQGASFEPALIDEHPSPDTFMRKSSVILSEASDQMQYATDKVNHIEDIVNFVSKGYQMAKDAYQSPIGQKIRKGVNTFFETGDKISKVLSKL